MPIRNLVELRILPSLALARLGSSPEPQDNYELRAQDVGYRQIEPALSLRVTDTGEVEAFVPTRIRFRDSDGRIRPVAPFLEVWAQFEADGPLEPLTAVHLQELGLSPGDLRWRVRVANHKAYRRTRAAGDRIEAETDWFNDHEPHPLVGRAENFKPGKSIPFGSARYLRPSPGAPEIRLRFTPAAGHVFGPYLDGVVRDDVYDPVRGRWQEYADQDGDPRVTNPGAIYAGQEREGAWVSKGYLDDACDGIVEARLEVGGRTLSAFGRVASGPPHFAPDSLPVRTIADELEQAAHGPEVNGVAELADAKEIVRRALETVRQMNTAVMNRSTQAMARMDTGDTGRAPEPIMDPAVADSLAVQMRHERVLLALESGTLAWFARMLRPYDAVGDLSTEARRKMPALMRGADARHLALTRRQVSIVRSAAARPEADARPASAAVLPPQPRE